MPTTNRLLKYLRVSKNDDGKSTSTTEQDACLTALAGVHNLMTVRTITDDDRSASDYATRDREGWPEVLAAVAAGECDYLGLWEQARSTRQLGEYAELRDLCEKHGVKWLTPEGIIDLTNDGHRLSTGVKALLDEQSSRDTSKRTRRALASRAEQGRPHGRNVYGYRRVYGADRSLVAVEIVEEEADVLRRMKRAVLAGESLASIVTSLNTAGVPMAAAAVSARVTGEDADSGKGWTARQVKRAMLRPEYAGLRTHRGQVVATAMWPALWDEATHRRLVAVLTDPARGEARSMELRHYLSNLIECGHCHVGMRVTARPHGGDAYMCQTPGCRKVAVSKKDVEPAITWLVLQAVRDRRFIRDDTARIIELRAEVTAAKGRLEEATAEFLAGRMSASLLATVEQQTTARIADLDAAIDKAEVPVELPSADTLAQQWDDMTAHQRRHVTRLALGRIVLETAGRKRVPVLSRLSFPDLGVQPFQRPERDETPLTMDDPLIGRAQAADTLGVTLGQLHAWMRDGRLRSIRDGRNRWLSAIDVERLYDERTPPWAA